MPRPAFSRAVARWVFFLGFVLLVGGALASCAKPQAPAAVPSLTVEVAAPKAQRLPREAVASGAVAAWEEVGVGAEVSGLRVSAVNAEVGDRVRKGQVLVRLDARTLQAQLEQAEAGVTQAAANLEAARGKAARARTLAKQQLIAAQDAESLFAAETAARAQLDTARAARDNARLQRDFSGVLAPDDGVISARNVQPGQVVAAGTELLRLIRNGRLEWRGELAEADLIRVVAGMPARIRAADGSEVAGRVRQVSPALDSRSRTGTVYVDLPEPGAALRAGMFVEGRIVLGESEGLTVPAETIVRRDGRAYVFVVDANGKARERGVETGAVLADRIEVRTGLAANDRVVQRGAGFLNDGDTVRVVGAAAHANASVTLEASATEAAR